MSTHYDNTVVDSHDELGFGFADIEYRLLVTVPPADDAAGTVEIDDIEIVAVHPRDCTALTRPLTEADLSRVRDFVELQTSRHWPDIMRAILDGDVGAFEPRVEDCCEDDADVFRSIGWGVDEDYRSCLGDEE